MDVENIGGLNLYTYCNNNPIKYYDPTGHSVLLVIFGIIATVLIGGAISGAFGALDAHINGTDPLAGFIGGFINGAIASLGATIAMAVPWGAGLAIAAVTGFAAGIMGESINQGLDSVFKGEGWQIKDGGSIIWSGISSMVANVVTFGLTRGALKPKIFGIKENYSMKLITRVFKEFAFSSEGLGVSALFTILYGLMDFALRYSIKGKIDEMKEINCKEIFN